MPTDDSQYLVTLPIEIKSIVSSIFRHKTLVRLDVPGQTISLLSTILEIDAKSGALVMDVSSEASINVQLLRRESVRFQAMLQRILIEFQGPLTAATQNGKPALVMPQPTSLKRMQRREYFRVDVPPSSPATCTIRSPELPGGALTLTVRDISAGGLQLADNQQLLGDATDAIYDDCVLHMPDIGSIELRLRGVRTLELTQDNGKILHAVACRFVKLPNNRQITVQQYIGTLERLVMSRRWGGED